MSEHYFSHNPQAKSAPKTWRSQLRGHLFSFTSDRGVFSKQGIDFGTRLLIERFKEPEISGNFLDLGCGYGPIGIAIAYQYQDRHVFMADVNERAVLLAKQNAKANDIKNTTVIESDGFSQLEDQFAAIITNPPIRAGKKLCTKCLRRAIHIYSTEASYGWLYKKSKGLHLLKRSFKNSSGVYKSLAEKKATIFFERLKLDLLNIIW